MIRTIRISTLALPFLTTALWLGVTACGSNEPAAAGGNGGEASTTAAGPTSGAGGTPGVTSAGPTTTTSAGPTTTSGDPATTSAATTTTSTGGDGVGMPACAATVKKGLACAATDQQLCYKTCGPLSSGFKSETCTGGVYAEQSGCTFPEGVDYSCYKIPAAIDASCPAATPQAGQACTVAACTLCNVGGQYLDTGSAPKMGYCVCPAPGASGTSKWSCASATAWPCPAGQGC